VQTFAHNATKLKENTYSKEAAFPIPIESGRNHIEKYQ